MSFCMIDAWCYMQVGSLYWGTSSNQVYIQFPETSRPTQTTYIFAYSFWSWNRLPARLLRFFLPSSSEPLLSSPDSLSSPRSWRAKPRTNQRRPESKVREIHQKWETYGKLIGSHGISPTLNNLNNTSGSGPGMPCPVPVQSLSSALPPSSRRTTSRRSCCSTSRFGHSSRHFEGVHQRNCCARDRWHSTNNTTENNHNQESQATREIYSFKSSWVLSLMMKLVGLCYGWAVWSM